jgi:hypothetical protein
MFIVTDSVICVCSTWRRGRDSNPRGSFRPPIDLANRPLQPLGYLSVYGGRGGIRTHGTVSGTTVFKTVTFNRSVTLPGLKNRGKYIKKLFFLTGYKRLAKSRASTCLAPADRNALVAAIIVPPVVTTSSTKRTFLP